MNTQLTPDSHSICARLFCTGLLLAVVFSGSSHSLAAADWWSESNRDFFAANRKLGVGTQKERSTFAWMLWSRANQPAGTLKVGKATDRFSQWEGWASTNETYTASPEWPSSENRRLKLVKVLKQVTDAAEHGGNEEVMLNRVSFDYVTNPRRPFYNRAGIIRAVLAAAPFNQPIGAIQIKAHWTEKPMPGMHVLTDAEGKKYGLDGMHIMAKIIDATYPDESWFWTTFEFKDNPNRAGALRFITFKDALSFAESQALMKKAGLAGTPWLNYRCNGTQTRFVVDGKPVILGNTTMEAQFASPSGMPSTKWKTWRSSCHTCHGTAAGKAPGGNWKPNFFGFPAPIGKASLPSGFKPIDFDWSSTFRAPEVK